MNSRNLIALLASLVVLVALAVAVSVSRRQHTGDGDLFLPGLKTQLNDVSKIVVRTGGDKTVVTLERQKDAWIIAESHSYPADVGKIRKNLIELAEARVLEEKTANPEFYDRLNVDDIEKPAAGGVRLDISAGDKTTSVIIGNTGVGGGDRAYVRRPGEPKSWLVSGSFETPKESTAWLDRSVTNIEPKRIHAVTITRPDGPKVRAEKSSPDAADMTVPDVPAGRALAFPGVANAIGAALSDLSFENVEPAAGFAPGAVKPVVTRFETFDGLVVEARSYKLPAGLRVRFSASADKTLADRFAPTSTAATAPTESKDAQQSAEIPAESTKRKSFDDVKAEADQLNTRLGNWVYALPDFKAEQLTKKLEDLLQPKQPAQ